RPSARFWVTFRRRLRSRAPPAADAARRSRSSGRRVQAPLQGAPRDAGTATRQRGETGASGVSRARLLPPLKQSLLGVEQHAAVAGQGPVILVDQFLGFVGGGAQPDHDGQDFVVEGVGLGALVLHGADAVGGLFEQVGGVGHFIGVACQGGEHLALGLGGDALQRGGLGGGGAGHLAHVGGGGGDQLLAGDLEHGARFDVDDLGVVLHLHFVAAEQFGLGQHAELFHQGHVLGVLQGDHGVGGTLAVGQAAALGFGLPGFAVAVAVEDHPAVVVQRLFDPGGGGALKIGGGGGLFHKVLQGLGHGGVEDGVRVGQVLGGAGHAELELVAGEGEGGSTVAVGGVLAELGQHVHAQVHLHLHGARVGGIAAHRVDDGFQFLAHKDRDDGRRGLVGAQAVVVAGGGDRGAQQVGVFIHGLDHGG